MDVGVCEMCMHVRVTVCVRETGSRSRLGAAGLAASHGLTMMPVFCHPAALCLSLADEEVGGTAGLGGFSGCLPWSTCPLPFSSDFTKLLSSAPMPQSEAHCPIVRVPLSRGAAGGSEWKRTVTVDLCD